MDKDITEKLKVDHLDAEGKGALLHVAVQAHISLDSLIPAAAPSMTDMSKLKGALWKSSR